MSMRFSAMSALSPPVAEVLPLLPNTMDCTLTAVPRSSAILFCLRYSVARGLFQLPNTASMASCSCTLGSCGNCTAPSTTRLGYAAASTFSAKICLNSLTSSCRSSAVRSVSDAAPRACFMAVMAFSNRSPSRFMTTLENIWMKRR